MEERLEIVETTCRDAGHCNYCNKNIGYKGTINHNQTIYEVSGLHVTVRFCKDCLDKFYIKLLAAEKKINRVISDDI